MVRLNLRLNVWLHCGQVALTSPDEELLLACFPLVFPSSFLLGVIASFPMAPLLDNEAGADFILFSDSFWIKAACSSLC